MNRTDWLAERFEEQRPRLRVMAYRMLGSLSEADDALQDAWVRLSRTDTNEIDSLGAWLTTVVARVALSVLRSRRSRREQSLEVRLPDPIVEAADGTDPENAALLADSVGLAMLVVLDTLTPAERLAFVLHDMFAVPFEDVARIVNRSPAATRQLASRARRRVQGSTPTPDRDLEVQWRAAEAFRAAARDGDFKALFEVLDPEVVLRADFGAGAPGRSVLLRGAEAVAKQAALWARVDLVVHRVRVNGGAGVVLMVGNRLFSVAAMTVKDGKIVELDFLADPERLARLDLEFLSV
jgi:RNA polymerase sigma-70 factor (ECF subfamily)